MDVVLLEVQERDKSVSAKGLLRSNLIPLEYYGRGVKNKSLQVDYQSFRKAYRVAGANTIIELNVNGKEKVSVLVHEVDQDPVTDKITHVDFINVRMGEEINAKVPLEFVGMAPAVKDLAGTLMTHITEIEIKCLPKDLIHKVEVSIDSLVDFSATIHVSDLLVPSTVAILNTTEDIVAAVIPPRVEEEETTAVAEGEEGEEGVEGAEGEAVEGEAKEEGDGESKE